MKIEFTVPSRRLPAQTGFTEPSSDPQVRPARIARLVALAHKLDGLVRSGTVSSYGELARLGHVSPARLTQIMTLLYLAPSIQEYLLFLSVADAHMISELALRKIARAALGSAARHVGAVLRSPPLIVHRDVFALYPSEFPCMCRETE